MSLSMMIEILSLRAGEASSKTKRFTYRNNCEYKHHNLKQFSSHHFASHARHRHLWQCVTSWTFCWLFSCLVTSVVYYPCDILVSGMMSSYRYQINYHSFLVWANLYFHFLFNTFLKLRTFPMREFESGLSHVLLTWIFGSFHSSANSRNDHDRLSRSQHNWCYTFFKYSPVSRLLNNIKFIFMYFPVSLFHNCNLDGAEDSSHKAIIV